MKDIVNSFRLLSLRARIAVLSLGLMLVGDLSPLWAQTTNYGIDMVSETTTTFKDMFSYIVRLLQVVTGIGAAVTLIILIFQVLKGERDSIQKIAIWVFAFIIALTFLSILSRMISKF